MRTFVVLFGVAAAFGAAIAVAYWFVAREEAAGTALLAVMTAALVFAAGYAVVAERDARLVGDRSDETFHEAAGEELGIFTIRSPYPVLIAVCTVLLLSGLLWSPFLAVAALIGMILCFWRLGVESARV